MKIYFTAIDGDHPIELTMEEGEREISVSMDNGELWITLTGEDKVYLDTDATFSAVYTVLIDKPGTYTLVLKAKHASGSVNY